MHNLDVVGNVLLIDTVQYDRRIFGEFEIRAEGCAIAFLATK